jgi:hypothetical protein
MNGEFGWIRDRDRSFSCIPGFHCVLRSIKNRIFNRRGRKEMPQRAQRNAKPPGLIRIAFGQRTIECNSRFLVVSLSLDAPE